MRGPLKSNLRRSIRAQRKQLSSDVILHASQKISEQLMLLPCFASSHHVGFYKAHENEIDLSAVVHATFQLQKSVYFPVMSHHTANELLFYKAKQYACYQKNAFGIDEPSIQNQTPIDAQHLNLIISPLVAFDQNCHRLGRGAGYYDRLLAFALTVATHERPILIGVGYEFQKVESTFPEAWDVPMDFIVTEKKVYSAKYTQSRT